MFPAGKGAPATAPDVARAVECIVGCKWSVSILLLIAEGVCRPSALLRASKGLSTKVMNERLLKMQRFGILEKRVEGAKPPLHVEWLLTDFGRRFIGLLDEVRKLQSFVDAKAISGPEDRPPLPSGQSASG